VKIVLDNTILVRANERSQGLARELLIDIVEGEHRLLLSNEMPHELARVLRYPRLLKFFGLTEEMVFDYVTFLRQSSEIVTLDPLVAAPIRDVNDIIVMQTAIIGEAEMLCTKDEDFFEDAAAPTFASWVSPCSTTLPSCTITILNTLAE
jgi:putative PIN family toxin of toxin-antitoxin system